MPELNNGEYVNTYPEIIFGDLYDPTCRIHNISESALEERWFLQKEDSKFGWYVNYPVYKKDIINNGDYAHNIVTDGYDYVNEEGGQHTIEYMYTLFDSNYNKLETPLKDVDDGNIEIKHGLLDWMKAEDK